MTEQVTLSTLSKSLVLFAFLGKNNTQGTT